MSIFAIMNYVAWGLCALIVYLLVSDIVKVEKQKRAEKDSKKDSDGGK